MSELLGIGIALSREEMKYVVAGDGDCDNCDNYSCGSLIKCCCSSEPGETYFAGCISNPHECQSLCDTVGCSS